MPSQATARAVGYLSSSAPSSVRMLDLTYGHLVAGSEAVARERLEAFMKAAHDSDGIVASG
jgi:hypothetical protein